MREIERSALAPYTPAQMFALVDDVERYPEFLPWVSAAKIIERSEHQRVGQLTFARAGLHEQITTRNLVQPPGRLEMHLVEGPFRVLEGVWTFDAIVDTAQHGDHHGDENATINQNDLSPHPIGTRISLAMRFEFKSRVIELLLASSFESSCDSWVDAFCKRARVVYRKDGG